ncbi:MAG: amino acid permease, partial [Limosilactobacillus fermentum]
AKLSKKQVPATAVIVSVIVVGCSVILNYLVPSQVFTVVTSMTTTAFLFVWTSIILAHLKYHRQNPGQREFKMPLAPFTDYLFLAFMAATAVVLCMSKETLPSVISAVIWLAALGIISLSKRPTKLH